MTPYDEDPEHAGLLGDLYSDGEPTGAGHENAPSASQGARGTIQNGRAGGQATDRNLSTNSAEKSRANASVSALKVAELRAALAAVKAAPRGRRDMRRLAVAYEAIGETPVWLRRWDPEIAAIVITAETPQKIKNIIKSNGKTPVKDDWYNDATSGSTAYERFTDPKTGGSVQGNIGAANGALRPNGKRGLKVDIDTKATGGAVKATRAERVRQLEAKVGPLGVTVMTLSATHPDLAPEVGACLHFETPADVEIHLNSHPVAGTDVTQQVLLPGSEINGRFYDMAPGLGFGDVETAPASRALIDAVTRKAGAKSTFDEATNEAKTADGVKIDDPGNIARAVDWLVNHAPKGVGGAGKHDVLIAVIQKVRDFGISREMTLNLVYHTWNKLHCDPQYDIERLRKHVYTVDRSRQSDVGSGTAEAVFGPFEAEAEAESDWPDPVALPAALAAVAPFDPAFLPNGVARWAMDIAERMQCPADYVGVSAIVALGSVLGRRAALRLSNGWYEHANLWGMLVGPPGTKKTPATSEALSPLAKLEAEARTASGPAWAAHERAYKAYKIRLSAAEKVYQKACERGEDAGLKDVGPEPARPQNRRYKVDDATYEALGEILADNPNGVLSYRDELVTLLKHLDREENSTGRGFYLTAWGGKQAYEFDRIGRGNLRIEAACLSVLGSTQPGKLSSYVQRALSDSGNDGMLQRFGLLVWPDKDNGDGAFVSRDPDDGAREDALRAFRRADKFGEVLPFDDEGGEKCDASSLFDGAASSASKADKGHLRLDAEAQAVFVDWYNKLERRLRSDEWPSHLNEHFSKYRGLIPKLALVDHVADGYGGDVGVVSVRKGIAFAAYLETHAVRAYGAGPQGDVDAAKAILARIKSGALNRDGFTSRDIYHSKWKGLDKVRTISGLELLVDYDWLKATKSGVGGRPRTIFVLNPKATLA